MWDKSQKTGQMVYCIIGGAGTCIEKTLLRLANGFEPYFCKKSKMGEMDFVIEMSGKVVPIEVKSGKSYKTHKALDNFKDSKTGTGLSIKNACI